MADHLTETSTVATVLPPLEPDDEDTILEADEGYGTDDASSINEQIANFPASLSASVIDYPEEYGRRYHAFRPGRYLMPNDEAESQRLDMMHLLTSKLLGNRLFLAPLDIGSVHRILDIGTGTGTWAIEMGDAFQHAEVIGNDLSAIQPDWIPSNVKFEIDDVESPWIGHQKYDFIMCRYMAASIRDWPQLVRNIYENLKPGGWAEFQDMNTEYYSDDGTLTETHATRAWNKTFVSTLAGVGVDPGPGPRLHGWVQGHGGFRNIFHRKYKVPIGPWTKSKFYKDVGLLNLIQILEGLEGFSLRMFCGVLGRSREDVLNELVSVEQELRSNAFHSLFDIHVVYGQKPY